MPNWEMCCLQNRKWPLCIVPFLVEGGTRCSSLSFTSEELSWHALDHRPLGMPLRWSPLNFVGFPTLWHAHAYKSRAVATSCSLGPISMSLIRWASVMSCGREDNQDPCALNCDWTGEFIHPRAGAEKVLLVLPAKSRWLLGEVTSRYGGKKHFPEEKPQAHY